MPLCGVLTRPLASSGLLLYRGETKVLRQFVASKLIHESAAVVVGVFALRAVGEKEKEEGQKPILVDDDLRAGVGTPGDDPRSPCEEFEPETPK